MKLYGSEDGTSFKNALKNGYALMFIIKSLPLGKIIPLSGIFVKKGVENHENCLFEVL
jgi:hypothetical protein